MDSTPEPINWNEVKTLLENRDKEVSVIAEGVAELNKKADVASKKLEVIEERLDTMEPIMRTIARDMKELKENVEKRLTAVESKVGL